jgi:hypothetical protein
LDPTFYYYYYYYYYFVLFIPTDLFHSFLSRPADRQQQQQQFDYVERTTAECVDGGQKTSKEEAKEEEELTHSTLYT